MYNSGESSPPPPLHHHHHHHHHHNHYHALPDKGSQERRGGWEGEAQGKGVSGKVWKTSKPDHHHRDHHLDVHHIVDDDLDLDVHDNDDLYI